jgi:hypothetical protein
MGQRHTTFKFPSQDVELIDGFRILGRSVGVQALSLIQQQGPSSIRSYARLLKSVRFTPRDVDQVTDFEVKDLCRSQLRLPLYLHVVVWGSSRAGEGVRGGLTPVVTFWWESWRHPCWD